MAFFTQIDELKICPWVFGLCLSGHTGDWRGSRADTEQWEWGQGGSSVSLSKGKISAVSGCIALSGTPFSSAEVQGTFSWLVQGESNFCCLSSCFGLFSYTPFPSLATHFFSSPVTASVNFTLQIDVIFLSYVKWRRKCFQLPLSALTNEYLPLKFPVTVAVLDVPNACPGSFWEQDIAVWRVNRSSWKDAADL